LFFSKSDLETEKEAFVIFDEAESVGTVLSWGSQAKLRMNLDPLFLHTIKEEQKDVISHLTELLSLRSARRKETTSNQDLIDQLVNKFVSFPRSKLATLLLDMDRDEVNPSTTSGEVGSSGSGPSLTTRVNPVDISRNIQTLSPAITSPAPLLTPKLPTFSGDNVKGDLEYAQWRYHARCLVTDPAYRNAPHLIMQAIRQSLRGTAAALVLHLGEIATPEDVLQKFDVTFGIVLGPEQLLRQFFAASQGAKESVVSWACRLQNILTQLQQRNAISAFNVQDLLRTHFWAGLSNSKVREGIRTRYENNEDFDNLFTFARKIESEYSTLYNTSATLSQQARPLNNVQTDAETSEDSHVLQQMNKTLKNINSQMKSFDSRLKEVENRPRNIDFRAANESHSTPRSQYDVDQTPNKKKNSPRCPRCGYSSHTLEQCVAKKDIKGNPLN
jgi:hypothetical protein